MGLHSQRNLCNIVSALPVEIATYVFQLIRNDVVQPYRDMLSASHLSWIRVTHVCRAWREVALSCPELWCSIDLSMGYYFEVGEMLERSKSAPLQVHRLRDRAWDWPAWMTVKQEFRRVQTLDIRNGNEDNLEDIFALRPSLPILESITFLAKSPFIVKHPLDYFRDLPSLHALHLANCNLKSHLPFLPRLTAFILEGIETRVSLISLPNLLQSLQNMPALEVLELKYAFRRLSEEHLQATTQIVSLPNISRLSIIGVFSDVFAVTNFLQFPLTASVALGCQFITPDGPGLASVPSICSRLHGNGAPSISTLHISLDSPNFQSMRFAASDELGVDRFRFDYDPENQLSYRRHSVQICRLMCGALPLAGLQQLKLDLDDYFGEWSEFLEYFASVVHLSATFMDPHELVSFLQACAKPGYARRLCTLSLSEPSSHVNQDIIKRLVRLLRRRARSSMPITKLQLSLSLEPETIAQLMEFTSVESVATPSSSAL